MKTFLLFIALIFASPLYAASIPNLGLGASGGEPVNITAKGDLEWDQKAQVFTVNEDVVVTKGTMKLTADRVRVLYNNVNGKRDIYRVYATGNPIITTPTEKIEARNIDYDLKNDLIIFSGDQAVLTSSANIIKANKIKYYQAVGRAEAEGSVSATNSVTTMKAENLIAYFKQNKKGDLDLQKMDARNNIEIINGEERVYADAADYTHASGIAHLTGNVLLRNPQGEIKGGLIEYDLIRGVSKLTPGKDGVQVEGVFIPKAKKED